MENNNNSNTDGGDAKFNQAYFMQIRLNDLFGRIDRLSCSPMLMNPEARIFNYHVIANDLFSAYQTISSKLKDGEKEILNTKRKQITNQLLTNSPHKMEYDWRGKRENFTDYNAWYILSDLFIDFRMDLEKLMDKKGLGNPSKQDPTKSSVNM